MEVHRWHYAYGTQGYATADALHEAISEGLSESDCEDLWVSEPGW